MSKKNTPHADAPAEETLQEESERILRENQENLFKAWKEENPAPAAPAPDAAEMAVEIAEKALRPFGSSALAGLRSGGAFVAALKGADDKARGRAAARLNLAREKVVAKKGATLRADIPESALAAAKAAEQFMFDLGVEVAKRSDLF